jgi:two-component system sensor histidine kinase YesM
MHRASNNDYDIVDSFHGDDEISETFHDLKILVQQVKQKEAEMYQEQIREQKLMNEQQEMEYKMLANQINPHFLYNTLETIRMKALTEGNRDVATAIKLLGKSMRYVLENTGTSSTTLQKELDYIDTYMKIQKLRFGDRINYSLSVAEDVHPGQCEILPLLLQPIAENAISHGLECTAGGGNIHIDIRLLGSSVLSVTITDNGTGISPEKLQALKGSLNLPCKTKTNSIGLYNINRRIRLCYGECYGLRLKSEDGKGTQVNLTIPYTFTEEIKK